MVDQSSDFTNKNNNPEVWPVLHPLLIEQAQTTRL